MNKRYIDFVPVDKRGVNRSAPKKVEPEATNLPVRNGAPKRMSVKKSATREPEFRVEELFEEKPLPAGVSTGLRKMIPRANNVSSKRSTIARGNIASRGGINPKFGVIEDYRPKTAGLAKKKVGPEGPRITKFLNTNKIEKRPLSGTYAKKVVPVPETVLEKKAENSKKERKEKRGPERIISFPERDSKAGMIIAVILTIILGAAAGTVAFLLLPK